MSNVSARLERLNLFLAASEEPELESLPELDQPVDVAEMRARVERAWEDARERRVEMMRRIRKAPRTAAGIRDITKPKART